MTQKTVETRVRQLFERLSMPHALASLDAHLPKDPSQRLAVLKTLEGILSIESAERWERRIARRIQDSKLPDHPTLQSFDFDFQPTLDRELIMELATLEWVDRNEDLVLTGQSGTGKSHIAKALCLIACSQGRRVRYTSCADMLAELFATLADGSLKQVLGRYTRPSLLLVDDLGYDPIEQEQAREAQLLYKVLEARHGKVSTIITSNFSAKDWGDYLGNQYLTVALLDRLLFHAVAINIDGPSYRLAKHEERQRARKKAKRSKKEGKPS
jgi:DNA replication protein DnaC